MTKQICPICGSDVTALFKSKKIILCKNCSTPLVFSSTTNLEINDFIQLVCHLLTWLKQNSENRIGE